MILVTKTIPKPEGNLNWIPVYVDRHKLSHRRFRMPASNGLEFAFDLETPLEHGDCIHYENTMVFYMEQRPEPCLLIPYANAEASAKIGWKIGNLHFKASFSEKGICVEDDLAVRQLLEREHIEFQNIECVFQPDKTAGHRHDHELTEMHHYHDHA